QLSYAREAHRLAVSHDVPCVLGVAAAQATGSRAAAAAVESTPPPRLRSSSHGPNRSRAGASRWSTGAPRLGQTIRIGRRGTRRPGVPPLPPDGLTLLGPAGTGNWTDV